MCYLLIQKACLASAIGYLQISEMCRKSGKDRGWGHVWGTFQIMPDGRTETITGFTFRLADGEKGFIRKRRITSTGYDPNLIGK